MDYGVDVLCSSIVKGKRGEYVHLLLVVDYYFKVGEIVYRVVYRNGLRSEYLNKLLISVIDNNEQWIIELSRLTQEDWDINYYEHILESVQNLHPEITNKDQLYSLWEKIKKHEPVFSDILNDYDLELPYC